MFDSVAPVMVIRKTHLLGLLLGVVALLDALLELAVGTRAISRRPGTALERAGGRANLLETISPVSGSFCRLGASPCWAGGTSGVLMSDMVDFERRLA